MGVKLLMFNHQLLSGIVCLKSVTPSLNCRNLHRQKAKGLLSLLCFFSFLCISWSSFTLEKLQMIWVAMG